MKKYKLNLLIVSLRILGIILALGVTILLYRSIMFTTWECEKAGYSEEVTQLNNKNILTEEGYIMCGKYITNENTHLKELKTEVISIK